MMRVVFLCWYGRQRYRTGRYLPSYVIYLLYPQKECDRFPWADWRGEVSEPVPSGADVYCLHFLSGTGTYLILALIINTIPTYWIPISFRNQNPEVQELPTLHQVPEVGTGYLKEPRCNPSIVLYPAIMINIRLNVPVSTYFSRLYKAVLQIRIN